MKTSAAGRAAITQREGCRLVAYRDSRGIWTIGTGHVDMTLPVARAGMVITREQADAMLAADLGQVEAVINSAVTVPISQNEFDAMASLGFNIGVGGLRKSSVIRKLNGGDIQGAADAFLMWSKPAVLAGRRKAERQQFLQPDIATAAARATTLAVRATRRSAQAGTATKAAAIATAAAPAVAMTAAAAATVPQVHHVVGWLLAGAGLLAAAALAAAIAAGAIRARATALAAKAGAQSTLAHAHV